VPGQRAGAAGRARLDRNARTSRSRVGGETLILRRLDRHQRHTPVRVEVDAPSVALGQRTDSETGLLLRQKALPLSRPVRLWDVAHQHAGPKCHVLLGERVRLAGNQLVLDSAFVARPARAGDLGTNRGAIFGDLDERVDVHCPPALDSSEPQGLDLTTGTSPSLTGQDAALRRDERRGQRRRRSTARGALHSIATVAKEGRESWRGQGCYDAG
jgi:hypothetical protein